MFDTHCHLNFSRFKKNVDDVIRTAFETGITCIIVPGTDIQTSKKAIDVAKTNESIYAAVGVHPHHVYELKKENALDMQSIIHELELLVINPKVVAVGEVGMDRHVYEDTKYEAYNVDDTFINLQKELLKEQIKIAIKYRKSLILHNRKAKQDLLLIVKEQWDNSLKGRAVFHCCEPDMELLEFAKKYHMFIGVDGDITYYKEKQEFIKQVPLEMLVLETDSPFLLPEPLRSQKLFPNKPQYLKLIAEFIAELKEVSFEVLVAETTKNAKKLFQTS